MSFNVEAALCPRLEARCLGNLERHVALASSRSISGYIARKSGRGRATMFPALGQGFFRGTTPMEFDECSKALCPPSYHVYLGFRYHLDSRTKRERWFSSYLLVVTGMHALFPGALLLTPPLFRIRQSWLAILLQVDYPLILMLVMTAHVGPKVCRAIRDQLYGMIGRRRHVVAMYSPASIVDKLGDPALRILPYGYGPISVIGALVAAGDIGR
ncbi:hypothetical protein F2Q68_00040012 [Brassica cretica]|uniref:Uncharacterized protein n=1 Tax=Brassica cretica TaxID=69181 RepID=A0A8S9M913_BRACR|nr:hypothetical protein F2Q68_00040012 [Brassica cretica]